ncbi:flippase activity-associated protein Agl23 [Halobacterium litoreum]|uniref:Flippase activity-associated protein Agl23 n=1 Tax=Halobacterium litoreum TaxID=2039234 RepID=A0ABD5NED1_9EURY|nr:flippase activity-associated protein Agl23 [Halobacterium litoreum]UHH13621.1 TIGR03663 family protein [Halobacterium litoreum]
MPRPRDDSSRTRVAVALLAVAALALVARVWALGWRVAHQDEARVAHWVLNYMELGGWEYRAIIHGPFLPHVNGVVFSVLGPSDFTMRLVVAVVGGLLPLAAWLYRDYLSDAEVVAVGAFFALNPVLLYYSRFMRNDLLLAAFMFAALGFFLRALSTGKARYLYLGALPFALAFTTKENSLLYPVCWLGALVLVFDGRLVLAGASDDATRLGTARDRLREALRAAWRYKLHLSLAALETAVVVVAFYAPKPEFYRIPQNPGLLPEVVGAATLGTFEEFTKRWTATDTHAHSYIEFLKHDLTVLSVGAAALVAFALLGFFYERYGRERPRAIVPFCFYWGVFSLFGYPAVTDITAGWTAVNAVVPLAVPAGVGVGLVFEYGRSAVATGNLARARVAVVVLLVATAGTGAVAAQTSYVNAQGPGNPLIQYAQSSGNMQPTLNEIEEISAEHDGVDVMFYGDSFYAPNDFDRDLQLQIDDYDDPNDVGGGYQSWFDRLPLPWYFEQYDTNVSSTLQTETLLEHEPPVVVVAEGDEDNLEADLTERGYDRRVFPRYQFAQDPGPLVFYVSENATL